MLTCRGIMTSTIHSTLQEQGDQGSDSDLCIGGGGHLIHLSVFSCEKFLNTVACYMQFSGCVLYLFSQNETLILSETI